jgi:hypothetical protein
MSLLMAHHTADCVRYRRMVEIADRFIYWRVEAILIKSWMMLLPKRRTPRGMMR